MSEQAGREMDARVAEKVMGFDCKHVDDGEGWCQFCGEEMIEYSQMYWDQNKWLQDRQSSDHHMMMRQSRQRLHDCHFHMKFLCQRRI
jgi:hypothetical protein